MEFAFVPLHSLGHRGFGERFDLARLPFRIADGLTIEDVEPCLPGDAFTLWKSMLGESTFEKVERVKHAIVHRYNESDGETDRGLTTLATSCLRLIRPMRQGVLSVVRGTIGEDGSFNVRGFELTERLSGVEVVEAHKLSTLRVVDAEGLCALLPEFIRAIEGEFWKFRMAAQFHDLGFFQSYNWKPKFLLWASAIESIFTSHSRDHQGTRVATERIKWFLGERTRIYPPAERWEAIPDCPLTIGDLLDDLYELRNFVAHGDKVPDSFFHTYPRTGVNGGVCKVEVLLEAASFIIRASLVKILRDGLLDHFADAAPAEAFFSAHGLVNSVLRGSP